MTPLFGFFASALLLNFAYSQEAGEFKDFIPGVKIVYSANINSEIEPCGCRTNPTGGIYRRFKLQEKELSGEKLIVDSGDLFYKSYPAPPFLEKQWNVQAEGLASAMKLLGLEAMVPGELDLVGGLSEFKKLTKLAQTKVLAANLFEKKTGKKAFDSNMIVVKGGKKVGIFGVVESGLELTDEIVTKDPFEEAKKQVQELRKKVDVLIALTHLGLDRDKELAANVKGIDLILGSHSQSFVITPEKVGETLVLQPSFRGQHLGVFENGTNRMYQVDARYDDENDKTSEMAQLVRKTKILVNAINKDQDEALLKAGDQSPHKKDYQTFVSCLECHVKQFEFHKKTPHFRAYDTLVKAKQAGNLECLKCHTVGAQIEGAKKGGGWSALSQLVVDKNGKSIPGEAFLEKIKDYNPKQFEKIAKVHFNVQCENCHGPAGEHPFSGTYSKQVSQQTCLQCHTPDKAPQWYKNGKVDPSVISKKLKQMSCPK